MRLLNALLREGADVNATDKKGKTALHHAVHKDYIELLNVLLAKGADPNATAVARITPLHLAVLRDSVKLVNSLVTKNADIYAVDEKNITPLLAAIAARKIKTVGTLLDHSFMSFFASNLENWNDMHGAIVANDLNIIRSASNEDLNQVTSSYKLSPLDLAIKLGNIEAIQVLLERNVEHNIDKSLQSAVKLKREDIIKFLLERYETLNPATIYEGKSCFHIACGINYSKIIIPLAKYSFLRKQSTDSTNDPVANNNTIPIARI